MNIISLYICFSVREDLSETDSEIDDDIVLEEDDEDGGDIIMSDEKIDHIDVS